MRIKHFFRAKFSLLLFPSEINFSRHKMKRLYSASGDDADASAPSKYVTLVSGDGFEFVVLREAAKISPIIKGMLDPRSQFAEAKDARCVFQEMR